MKVKDILDIAQGCVIAWDASSGEILFNSRKNNANLVLQYGEGDVAAIWPGLKQYRSNWPLDGPNVPVIGMDVAHNSWEKKGKEKDENTARNL